MKNTKTHLSWWWGLIFIGGCFISSNVDSTTNRGIRDLAYIPFDYTIFLCGVLMLLLLGTVLSKLATKKKLKLDTIFLLLMARIALVFLPVLYVSEQYYWGNILGYLVPPLVYLIIINRGVLLEKIVPFAKAFCVITVVQCIILFISSPVPYTNLLYKYYFVAPAGASNYLGCIMAVAFAIILFSGENKKPWFWFLLGLVGIFLTKSRTGLFTHILMPCLYSLVSTVKKGTVSLKILRRIAMLLLAVSPLVLLLVFSPMGTSLADLLDSFIQGYTSKGSDITSGRIDQFVNQFLSAARYPLFGAGFTFGDSFGSMHNFILEAFYVSGLAGLFVQIALLFAIAKRMHSESKPIGWIILTVFLVSFFEKILFTAVGEFMLWSIVGMLHNAKRLHSSKHTHSSVQPKNIPIQ